MRTQFSSHVLEWIKQFELKSKLLSYDIKTLLLEMESVSEIFV